MRRFATETTRALTTRQSWATRSTTRRLTTHRTSRLAVARRASTSRRTKRKKPYKLKRRPGWAIVCCLIILPSVFIIWFVYISRGLVMARVYVARSKTPKKEVRKRFEIKLVVYLKYFNSFYFFNKANQQRLFNKFVREKVESRLGKDFLLLHEIQEINGDIMEEIKSKSIKNNSFI